MVNILIPLLFFTVLSCQFIMLKIKWEYSYSVFTYKQYVSGGLLSAFWSLLYVK